MVTLTWSSDLDTGVSEIDTQHKRILAYINDLAELRNHSDRSRLGDVIGEMVDYTMSHFAFEESLMENAGYMFSGPHKRVHELFARKVSEMQSRYDAGEDIAAELHGMLSRWLFNHIRNEDHGYVDAVQAYLKMARGGRQAEHDRLKAELLQELETRSKSRGWFSRLFGG